MTTMRNSLLPFCLAYEIIVLQDSYIEIAQRSDSKIPLFALSITEFSNRVR